ncbi:hypothetical protein P5616_010610 [Priestia aryabhattai]|uniref:hypothetical protein n=1 Tax=Priestia aryabhattai TaxID=412384 RepID=UPI0024536451|nr:hypothetical protein [Priestia aryabhattai]MDH3133594.1 hypothetical protein [Priestia aryabhattai]
MSSEIRQVFGSDGEKFFTILNSICDVMKGVKYGFADPNSLEEVLKEDVVSGQQLLWFDVLQHSHFISCASLLRTKRWMDGIRYGAAEGNYIVFASSLRGLIESTADSYYAMRYIGKTLTDYFAQISLTLQGKVMKKDGKIVMFSSDPIDVIIEHFIHAKKMSDTDIARRTQGMSEELANRFKEVNQAKEPWRYIQILKEQEFGNLSPVYKELCEVTHPAGDSVTLFLGENPGHIYNLNVVNDEEKIQSFIRKFRPIISKLLVPSINPSLIALSVINEFPLDNSIFNTSFPSLLKIEEFAESMNLDDISGWVKLKESIDQQKLSLENK